jgi:OmpA-OmpF porin, OOP family
MQVGSSIFDAVIQEAASRFNLGNSTVTNLLRELLRFMSSDQAGGLGAFIERFRTAGLGSLVSSWMGPGSGASISATQLESVLGRAAIGRMASAAGLSEGAAAPVLAFLVPKVMSLLTPSGALPSSASLASQIGAYLSPASPQYDTVSAPRDRAIPVARRRNPLAWILPLLAIAALGVYFLTRQPVGTVEPRLSIANSDGKITYEGTVRDERTRQAIVDGLNSVFGAANVSGNLAIDGSVKSIDWLSRLPDLLAALRTPGVELTVNGNQVDVGGWLSAADRQAIMERVRGVLGTATVGSLGDKAADAVRAANEQAVAALGALGASFTGQTLVEALNQSVINFAPGSSAIPADSQPVIARAAEALKRAPAGTRIEIAGHTDNTGDSASNLALSQARAQAVADALVNAGVPPAMLTTAGYGNTRPVAGNDTEYGRFRNRRIEFSLR